MPEQPAWNGSLLKIDDDEEDGGMHQGDEEDTWI